MRAALALLFSAFNCAAAWGQAPVSGTSAQAPAVSTGPAVVGADAVPSTASEAAPGVNAVPKDARDGLPNTAAPGVNAVPKDARDGLPNTAGHWAKQGPSLLYYDPSGTLAGETGLGAWEEPEGPRTMVREVRGGASPQGRFAWILERTIAWNQDRTKTLSSKRLLRFFGSNGRELWTNPEADAPQSSEPLLFSADGETLIMSLHDERGWTAAVKNFLGQSLLETGPFPRLEIMSLTSNGKYALVRWAVPEESATHTFLDVAAKARVDIPSGELYLGLARITDDGKVYSGKKFVYDFTAKKP